MSFGYKTDREAVKREDEKRRAKGKFYSFKPGRTMIRVLPPWSSAGIWFRPTLDYFLKVDDEIIVLTAPEKGEDPIRNFERQLAASGEMNKQELAKALRARRRYLVNAVVIAEPDNDSNSALNAGVQVIGLPVRVKEALTKFDIDEAAGYADITNVETGFNMIIEREGKNLDTKYTVLPCRERSNIFDIARQRGVNPDEWNLHDLSAITTPNSPEELQNALNRFLAADPRSFAAGYGPKTAAADNGGSQTGHSGNGAFEVGPPPAEQKATGSVAVPTIPPPPVA